MIARHQSRLFPDGQRQSETIGQRDPAPLRLQLARLLPKRRCQRIVELETVPECLAAWRLSLCRRAGRCGSRPHRHLRTWTSRRSLRQERLDDVGTRLVVQERNDGAGIEDTDVLRGQTSGPRSRLPHAFASETLHWAGASPCQRPAAGPAGRGVPRSSARGRAAGQSETSAALIPPCQSFLARFLRRCFALLGNEDDQLYRTRGDRCRELDYGPAILGNGHVYSRALAWVSPAAKSQPPALLPPLDKG